MEILTLPEAGQFLRIGRSSLYRLIRAGLPTVKIGGRRLVIRERLCAWIERQEQDRRRPLVRRRR